MSTATALASVVASLSCMAAKGEHKALFIGKWVAPFLILGIYNNLVKVHDEDGAANA